MIDSLLPPEQAHWEDVYRHKAADAVSWYRAHLDVSLGLLRQAGLNSNSRVIDVGGGASTLVDDLVDLGLADVTVLDLSTEALSVAQHRLGERAAGVHWLAGDLLRTEFPPGRFDLWHDRAVLHFLTTDDDARLYAAQATRAVSLGGYAVIGGFAPDGPERCSGLPVARRSADAIARLLTPDFQLVSERSEQHRTPGAATQSFIYALLQRV